MQKLIKPGKRRIPNVPKTLFLVLVVILFNTMPSAGQSVEQRSSRPPLSERVFYGGSFGLQFGNITNIELSPIVGIWMLPRLSIAAGPTYQYYKDPFGRTDIYGGRSFFRFLFIQDISKFIPLGLPIGFYIQGEYEGLSLEADFWTSGLAAGSRLWEHNVLAGLGISQALGMKSSMNISFLWVLTQPGYELYDNPEIRIDFVF